MKLHILSDLHLEFSSFEPLATDAEIIVLAGDIGKGAKGVYWARSVFPDKPILYVPGNHEFYGTQRAETLSLLRISASIIGATPVLKSKEPPYPKHPRYEEILDFLNKSDRATARWVALDDDPEIYPSGCRNLILCSDGFRDAEEDLLRTVLSIHMQSRFKS